MREPEPVLDDTAAAVDSIIRCIFGLSTSVRYVSILLSGQLFTKQAERLVNASASESDRYEELFINPALLTLVRQRGNLDCGGAKFLIVRYGNFFQVVMDLPQGHASVCFDLRANPLNFTDHIASICSSL